MARKKAAKAQEREVPPLTDAQLRARLKARPALKEIPEALLEFTLPVPYGARIEAVRDENQENGLKVAVHGVKLGERFVRPSVRGTVLRRERAGRSRVAPGEPIALAGYLPDHLPLKPVPTRVEKRLRVRPRLNLFEARRRSVKYTTTVFKPENRYTFNDTAFPWCTVGRVDTP